MAPKPGVIEGFVFYVIGDTQLRAFKPQNDPKSLVRSNFVPNFPKSLRSLEPKKISCGLTVLPYVDQTNGGKSNSVWESDLLKEKLIWAF